MSKAQHYLLGQNGEEVAKSYLEFLGYHCLHSNWRIGKLEVDLIMDDGEAVVFVEVKTRSSEKFGMPEESIDDEKKLKLVNAADAYMRNLKWEIPARFDIVSIIRNEREVQLKHFKDAFYPGEVDLAELI
jgi:putative endonuclease